MSYFKMLGLTLMVSCVIVASYGTARAQSYQVDPVSWSYGSVGIGSSATKTFTVTSTGTTSVTLYGIELTTTDAAYVCGVDVACDFAITASSPIPDILSTGEFVTITITFTPTTVGDHDAFLHLISNSSTSLEFIPLYGLGAPAETVDIQAVIEFFDASVADGSLVCAGPGRCDNRINAYRNMLAATAELIAGGEMDLACEQLWSIRAKTDGEGRPPDFVAGTAREALLGMIDQLMVSLGCY